MTRRRGNPKDASGLPPGVREALDAAGLAFIETANPHIGPDSPLKGVLMIYVSGPMQGGAYSGCTCEECEERFGRALTQGFANARLRAAQLRRAN